MPNETTPTQRLISEAFAAEGRTEFIRNEIAPLIQNKTASQHVNCAIDALEHARKHLIDAYITEKGNPPEVI